MDAGATAPLFGRTVDTEHPVKSAVCMIVKNEARDVGEWVAHHIAVGFGTVIVFDNLSTDGTAEVLAAFASNHDVRVLTWPSTQPNYQMAAYEHALSQHQSEFDWICFIDSDEFVVPQIDEDVCKFLARMEHGAAVAANWAIYGSSGQVAATDGLITERFLLRSTTDFSINRHVKSFVRPSKVKSVANPHFFDVDGIYLSSDGSEVCWEVPGIISGTPDYSVMQINHYFIKSKQDWTRKLRRGYHDIERSEAEFAAYDRNEVKDTSALKYIAKTKQILAGASHGLSVA